MKIILLSIIFAISLNIAHSGEVVQLEVEDVKATLMNDKKDKIVVFFTTWCTYCKPIILSKDLPKDKVVFISVDSDKDTIETFAKDMVYNVYHVVPTDDMKNLVTLSEFLGIKFATINSEGTTDFSIPYITFIDQDNKVIEESVGIENLQKYLK